MNRKDRVYIIAEAGVNHNGSIEMARQLIDVAAAAGADAVKFQTFKSETLVSSKAPKAEYQKASTGSDESQLQMLKKLELDERKHLELSQYCKSRNIEFLSTPFDEVSVDLLVKQLGMAVVKIASGEITNGPLLLKAARSKKPIILSTGMSTLEDIRLALGVLAFGSLPAREKPCLAAFSRAFKSSEGQSALRRRVTLLHCTTEYPAPFSEVNLRAMQTINEAFGLPVGLSDHTVGISVAVAATALGAKVIEKHFTLDRNLPGPDHRASLMPDELKALVTSIREVGAAMGVPVKRPTSSEKKNLRIARRSLIALSDIKKGELFSPDNLGYKRPGTGLSPLHYWDLLGKKARTNLKRESYVRP